MGFSIVICTHKPEPKIFQRLLNAILKFNTSSLQHEVIIIDNNSSPVIALDKACQSFITDKKNAGIITEKKPGLTAARIAGIEHAKYEWLIFFDDDNEPAPDYLEQLLLLIQQYPTVACWGPGNITVEYTAKKVPEWMERYKESFQQKSIQQVEISNQQWWQSFYPPGTGLAIKKEIVLEYVNRVKAGQYSLTDRTGKGLSSGGDVQMVLTAVQLNHYAGSAPGLKMNHLIDEKKTNLRYLMKHAFGTASSNLPAHEQVFFITNTLNLQQPSLLSIIKKFYYYSKVVAFKKGFRKALIYMAHYLGEIKGIYLVNKQNKPSFLYYFLCRIFRLS